jgi:hypothetical protein
MFGWVSWRTVAAREQAYVAHAAAEPPQASNGQILFLSNTWRARVLGIATVIALAGCGGGTRTVTATTAAPSSGSSTLAWQAGTPAPRVTNALIAQAGYGLSQANSNLGTVDEVFGAVPANAHVNPSAKTLNDQYARLGRCMGEYMKIHDLGHELALLIAYNRKDHAVQAAVEKASAVCEGSALTPDASYKQSLKDNP